MKQRYANGISIQSIYRSICKNRRAFGFKWIAKKK
jgi:hypothetical protein